MSTKTSSAEGWRAVGRVSALFRHPIKSMAAQPLANVTLDRNGVAGDRRFALRRLGIKSGFPWLSASTLPALVRYRVEGLDDRLMPTGLCAPSGEVITCDAASISAHFAAAHGVDVELTHLRQGIFDCAGISILTAQTLASLGQMTGITLDPRRFRPNILIDVEQGADPYPEDAWVGHSITFGAPGSGARVAVTELDERCVMINIHPDTGQSTPELLRAVVQHRDNYAGVYAVATRMGAIAIGDTAYVRNC